MDFVIGLITGFLALYLSLTNSLALQIEQFFNMAGSTTPIVEDTTKIADGDSNSQYERGGSIPDILIQNAAYQQANVVDSIDSYPTTENIDEAMVNVYCRYKTGNKIQATTGTGFFIHPDGIILTNAHVAQLLLLAELNEEQSECVIRTGSPAEPTYTADLLYISPQWLRDHAGIFNEAKPKGTGERDYALLYVNSGLNNQPMPGVFPALSVDTELMRVSSMDSTVTAGGYPAQALIKDGPNAELIAKTSTTTITELMTFGSNYADLFSIAGSKVGQQGSSGGPILNDNHDVIGMISTRGDDKEFGEGSLRAITLSYVDRTIEEETGFDLKQNLAGNLPYRAQLYKETMIPFLLTFMRWEME